MTGSTEGWPGVVAAPGAEAAGAIACGAGAALLLAAGAREVLGAVDRDVEGTGAVLAVGAGASGSTIVGVEVVVGMLAEGVGMDGRTIDGALDVVEGTEVVLGGVTIVVDGNVVLDGDVVVDGGVTVVGRSSAGAACWARAGVEPSARTAATAAVAQSERVGAWCVMNTTMPSKSKSYSLTGANPVKTNEIKRRTAFPYAR